MNNDKTKKRRVIELYGGPLDGTRMKEPLCPYRPGILMMGDFHNRLFYVRKTKRKYVFFQ